MLGHSELLLHLPALSATPSLHALAVPALLLLSFIVLGEDVKNIIFLRGGQGVDPHFENNIKKTLKKGRILFSFFKVDMESAS